MCVFVNNVNEEFDLGRFLFLLLLVVCDFVSSVSEEFDLGRLLLFLVVGLCQECKRGTRSPSIVVFTVAGDVCFC